MWGEHYEFEKYGDEYGDERSAARVMPGCSDRMCGAEDCGTCFPFAQYVYEDDIEDEDEIDEDEDDIVADAEE